MNNQDLRKYLEELRITLGADRVNSTIEALSEVPEKGLTALLEASSQLRALKRMSANAKELGLEY